MLRRPLLLLLTAFVVTGGAAARAVPPPPPVTVADVTLRMSDGVAIAATLYEPQPWVATAPFPAILMLHGLGGNRHDLVSLAIELSFKGYAVLTPDLRGHGESGGLVSIDGPREIQDVREEVDWLKRRPEVNGKIGGWGISLGGGAILRALVEGVPFATVETVETWTDLYSALAPQNLSKSGALSQFLSSVPDERLAPEVKAIRYDAIHSQNLGTLRAFAGGRSSRGLLSQVTTPVFMLQGRRDFAFDIQQAKAAMKLLRGPKRLYVGDFGHAPSKFPGPDIAHLTDEMASWFDTYLRSLANRPTGMFELAPEADTGSFVTSTQLPAVKLASFRLGGRDTIGGEAKVVRSTTRTTRKLETFGPATVRVDARLSGGWQRLVAILTATRGGSTTVVSEGGANTTGLSGRHRLAIHLTDDATKIPRGSRLTLTLAASSTAQDPGNLLYLDLPMPTSARVTIGAVDLTLPVLRKPVSK